MAKRTDIDEDKKAIERRDDLQALRALGREESLGDTERDAFADMLERLDNGQRTLTVKQRDWVRGRCETLGIDYGDPTERNRDVPRGKPVPLPEVLRTLPKAPPGRKTL